MSNRTDMLVKAKILTVGLPWAIAAFGVATAVLAIQKAQISRNIRDAKEKLEYLEAELVNANKPATLTTTVAPDEPSNVINYRLPGDLVPGHYNLYLHPDIASENFTGHVEIAIDVVRTTRRIILHSNKLNIHEVQVEEASTSTINVLSYELDLVREFLIIDVDTDFAAGRIINLSIRFSGTMQDKIVGLYSSRYTKPDGSQKAIATSKFEPTYARQAFPCFDEPAMKATFTVTLVHPTDGNYHALSNMNAEETIYNDLYAETYFKESVPMSTYLACFIVSDLEYETKNVEANGIGSDFSIRAFATSHQLSKVSFALDSAVPVTEFYIQYFGIEYPLPKLDMAAIPDFVSNAMEHWGLLTYRESVLLYDPDISSATNIQKIATVVAHELAHMWFGNLVTMMWWNDLWLNEGFARYMEYKATNQIYPDWDMLDQFLIHALHSVMKYDSSVASHPIVQTVSNPDQITEIFDTISYEKGASVIRMLEDFVGSDNFQKGVTNYLNKFKYKNAVTDDFLTEIEALGLDFDVKEVMRTWTEQMGFPVVEVSIVSDTEYKLTQKRFFSNPEDYDNNDLAYNYNWTIPITYVTSESSEIQRLWFDHDVQEITIDVDSTVKWIKLNDKQVGYYRVNYAEDVWQSLIAELVGNPERFSIADRAHLLNDAFSLADASQLSYDVALDMTTYLQQEFDYVPWSVATAKLLELQNILRYTDVYEDYLTYSRDLVRRAYEGVTWTVGDNHVENRFRVTILTAACSLGLPECLEEASERFTSWLSNPLERPAPDLREIVYYYGMQNDGTEKLWNQMWNVFKDELDASEKTKLMYGLSAIHSPWILYRFVELAWDVNNVRSQDYFNCLQNIAANTVGEAVVWDYVRDNWQQLVDRFGINERYLGRMIPSITERFVTETKLNEMTSFFTKYPDAGAGTASRQQALETVKNNIKWLEENKNGVAEWLNNKLNSEFLY